MLFWSLADICPAALTSSALGPRGGDVLAADPVGGMAWAGSEADFFSPSPLVRDRANALAEGFTWAGSRLMIYDEDPFRRRSRKSTARGSNRRGVFG